MRSPSWMLVCTLFACGPAAVPPDAPGSGAPGTDPAPGPPAARVADADPEPTPDAAPPPFAVSVHIGLDLRALPTNTTESGINLFVLGQGLDVQRLAGDTEVEIRHVPGAGLLIPVFRADSPAAAQALCERVVAAYLEQAPLLPRIREPAASVITPCAPYEPEP